MLLSSYCRRFTRVLRVRGPQVCAQRRGWLAGLARPSQPFISIVGLLVHYRCWKQAQHFRAHSKVSTDKGSLQCVLFYLLVLVEVHAWQSSHTRQVCSSVLGTSIKS